MDASVLPPSFAERTTLRVGGRPDRWVTAYSEAELVAEVRRADAAHESILLVGGGSNLLVADAGFPGTVIEVANHGIRHDLDPVGGGVAIWAAAGEPWTAIVDLTVASGWSGIEAMAGIPGRVGATPVQNVGAYGQDVAGVIDAVRVLDRTTGRVGDLPADRCGFGYRTSRFKAYPERWVVLGVRLRLEVSSTGVVRYAQLAEFLGVHVDDEAPLADIRSAVLDLRARKAMVLDAADHDAWSAGSFFTNPVVDAARAERIPPECPRYPAATGIKISAAWLIENAGIARGFRLAGSRAAVSSRHTLALTNRGGATAADIVDLARAVRDAVARRFEVTLDVEPRLVGVAI